jgi:hypothetical protein
MCKLHVDVSKGLEPYSVLPCAHHGPRIPWWRCASCLPGCVDEVSLGLEPNSVLRCAHMG